MNKVRYISFLLFLLFAIEIYPKTRVRVDRIDVIVHAGGGSSAIICNSDQTRRGIDGRQKSPSMLINDKLIEDDAVQSNLPMELPIIKDNLARTLRGYGMNPGDESVMFAQEGLSYDEGLDLFKNMYVSQIMIDQRVRNNLTITEDKVLKYYNEHPIIERACYYCQTAFIPFEKDKKNKGMEMDVDRFIQTGKGLNVLWSESSPIFEHELSENSRFIASMQPDEIKKQVNSYGIQLYKLCSKQPQRFVPLEKRYKEISDKLLQEEFQQKLASYWNTLRSQATIIQL